MSTIVSPNQTNGNGAVSETFDIGNKLRDRLIATNEQKERTQTKIKILTEYLKKMFERSPKRPRDTEGEMNEKIRKLESERTSSSLSLSQEKQLLRQIDIIKRNKIMLEECHVHEKMIQEKKNDLTALKDYLRTVEASIAELKSALSKVKLAQRLGCSTSELQKRVLDCPADKIGHVIGKNGSSLKQLENRTGVQIDVDKVGGKDGPKIHLLGSVEALDAAVREVENITLAVEVNVELTSAIVNYMIAKRSAVLNDLQHAHRDVHFDVSRNSTVLRLRGRPELVEMARNSINNLDVKTVTRELHSKEIGLVVGKGGSTISGLEEAFDVSMNVKDGNTQSAVSILEITGQQAKVVDALSKIENMLYENEEVEDYMFVDAMQRNMFLSKSGAVLKAIQKEATEKALAFGGGGGALLLFEKREDEKPQKSDYSKLLMRASRLILPTLRALVEDAIKQHDATVQTFSVDPSMISAIIGKGGSTIKDLRKEGVEIEVDKKSGTIKIQSPDDDAKQRVIEGINSVISENQVKTVGVDKSIIGIMFSDVGKEMRKVISDDLGVWMGIDSSDENVILRGTVEKIEEAANIVREFTINNYSVDVQIPVDDEPMLMQGGNKSYLSNLGKKHDVKTNLRRSKHVVTIRGLEEKVTDATLELKRFIYGGDGLTVAKMKIPESSLGVVIGKGGSGIVKMENDFDGISLDVHRTSNQLSLRGPKEVVKKCKCHVLRKIATTTISDSIQTTLEQQESLEKSNVLKRIYDDIPVQVTVSPQSIKLRGLSSDVKDAKALVKEEFTGVFEVSVDLESSHVVKLSKHMKRTNDVEKIQETTKATISLNESECVVNISGKRMNVKKAKNELITLLSNLCPGEIKRVKMSKPIFKALVQSGTLADIAGNSGANVVVDRELGCVILRSLESEEVCNAENAITQEVVELKKLNIVIRFDPSEVWIFPKITGKNNANLNNMENESKCKIRVSKAELTVAIIAEKEEDAKKGKVLIDEVISKAKKECVFIDFPESAVSSFLGKNRSNVKKMEGSFRVKIEQLKKDRTIFQVQGNEKAVQSATAEINNWLATWENNNPGEKLQVGVKVIQAIFGKGNDILVSIQKSSCVKIDMNRKDGTLTIRKGDENAINEAKKKINDLIEKENERNSQSVSVTNILHEVNNENSDTNLNGAPSKNDKVLFTNVNSGFVGKDLTQPETIPKEASVSTKNIESCVLSPSDKVSKTSQNLFDLLISDSSVEHEEYKKASLTNSSGLNGHVSNSALITDVSAPAGSNGNVYKSSSGFTVRL